MRRLSRSLRRSRTCQSWLSASRLPSTCRCATRHRSGCTWRLVLYAILCCAAVLHCPRPQACYGQLYLDAGLAIHFGDSSSCLQNALKGWLNPRNAAHAARPAGGTGAAQAAHDGALPHAWLSWHGKHPAFSGLRRRSAARYRVCQGHVGARARAGPDRRARFLRCRRWCTAGTTPQYPPPQPPLRQMMRTSGRTAPWMGTCCGLPMLLSP